MIVDVVMPKMGESINEGTILEWRKKVGESIGSVSYTHLTLPTKRIV